MWLSLLNLLGFIPGLGSAPIADTRGSVALQATAQSTATGTDAATFTLSVVAALTGTVTVEETLEAARSS